MNAAPYEPKICFECEAVESLDPTAEEFLMCGYCGEYFCSEHLDQTDHNCEFLNEDEDEL